MITDEYLRNICVYKELEYKLYKSNSVNCNKCIIYKNIILKRIEYIKKLYDEEFEEYVMNGEDLILPKDEIPDEINKFLKKFLLYKSQLLCTIYIDKNYLKLHKNKTIYDILLDAPVKYYRKIIKVNYRHFAINFQRDKHNSYYKHIYMENILDMLNNKYYTDDENDEFIDILYTEIELQVYKDK